MKARKERIMKWVSEEEKGWKNGRVEGRIRREE